MRRARVIARALAALAGNLLVLLWTGPWPAAVACCAVLSCLVCLARGALVPAACLAAALWTGYAVALHERQLQREDARVLAAVTITSLPAFAGRGRQFDGLARLVRRPGSPQLRVRVSWPRGAPPDLHAGETWQLALQLRTLQDVPNPGAVDGLRIAWRDHIHARAQVRDSPLNQRIGAADSRLLRLRESIARQLLDRVADPAAGALLAALAVGYTAEVGRDQWQAYNATGITHLIAISGMHVTLFAMIAMAGLRRVWAWWPWLAWRVRRESFVAIGGLGCAFGYALLAGWSVPTQRTVLMLAAAMGWRLLARGGSIAAPLGAAALAVLALDPFAVLAAGFWLSFGAVATILWREASRLRAPSGMRGMLALQLAITAALAPATIASFGGVSLVGLLVNPLAIPLFSLLLVPLVLLVAALLLLGGPAAVSAVPLWLGEQLATPTITLLALAARLPYGMWYGAPPPWWFLFAGAACLLLILPVGARLRLLVLAPVLAVLCAPVRPAEGGWQAWMLDAGGAPLTLIVTRAHAVVVGTGDRFGTAGARIDTLLVPAARVRGIRRIDLLVAPRLDRDVAAGIGAARGLLRAQRVAGTAGREGELPPGMLACASVSPWEWDGVGFALSEAEGRCSLTVTSAGQDTRFDTAVGQVTEPRGATLLQAPPGQGPTRVQLGAGPGTWHRRP